MLLYAVAIDIDEITVSPYNTPSPTERPIPERYTSPFLSNLPAINLASTYLARVMPKADNIEYIIVYAVVLYSNVWSIDGISASADMQRFANINTNMEYANTLASTLINRPFHLLITTIISISIPPAESIFSAPAGIPAARSIPYSSIQINPPLHSNFFILMYEVKRSNYIKRAATSGSCSLIILIV